MAYKIIGLLVLSVVFSTVSIADENCRETALSFDTTAPDAGSLNFEDNDKWTPKASDFELINYYTMSNACGERWALISVRNVTPGTSSFSGENIVALMADGSKRQGSAEKRIEGRTTESFTISFGTSKVPIVKLLVNTK